MARVQAVRIDDLPQRTGITMAQVEAVAAQLHGATNACVYGRMGVSTQRFGTVAQYLIQLMNIYLGQLDRAGGCLPNEAIVPVTGPGTSKGSRGRWSSRVRGLPEVCGELPVAVLREEIETPGAGQVRAFADRRRQSGGVDSERRRARSRTRHARVPGRDRSLPQ
ncbi:MAG: hypothetical protein IPP28_00245 [Xanthomonadales bacterium]|nr:hypothetical protein [Xanthomonadales bacterium]